MEAGSVFPTLENGLIIIYKKPKMVKYKEACEDNINADSAKLSCVIFCFSLVALIFSPIFF